MGLSTPPGFLSTSYPPILAAFTLFYCIPIQPLSFLKNYKHLKRIFKKGKLFVKQSKALRNLSGFIF